MRDFQAMLRSGWREGKLLCVGLDSAYDALPSAVHAGKSPEAAVLEFNRAIVDATSHVACAYKPNIAFYSHSEADLRGALWETCAYIRERAPTVPIILDAKRADIGNTNTGYLAEAFDEFEADAVTVNPYLGAEALAPFFGMAQKGIIVLCRTSNPGAAEFQEREVVLSSEEMSWVGDGRTTMPLYRYVALRAAKAWNGNANCALVVGATAPEALRAVRGLVGDMPILVPGVGAQSGDLHAVLDAGLTPSGGGLMVNASRSIIFASSGPDYAACARREAERLHGAMAAHISGKHDQ
jgi:orotidine-5'-phosphate decarboxylase